MLPLKLDTKEIRECELKQNLENSKLCTHLIFCQQFWKVCPQYKLAQKRFPHFLYFQDFKQGFNKMQKNFIEKVGKKTWIFEKL